MRIKNKRVLKNGAIAGYVYYKKDKKWKWRIVGHVKKNKKGGSGNDDCQFDWNSVEFIFFFNDDGRIEQIPSHELKSFFEKLNNYPDWDIFYGTDGDGNNLLFSNDTDKNKPEIELKSFICESKIGHDYFKKKAINLNPTNRNSKKSIKFYVNVFPLNNNN